MTREFEDGASQPELGARIAEAYVSEVDPESMERVRNRLEEPFESCRVNHKFIEVCDRLTGARNETYNRSILKLKRPNEARYNSAFVESFVPSDMIDEDRSIRARFVFQWQTIQNPRIRNFTIIRKEYRVYDRFNSEFLAYREDRKDREDRDDEEDEEDGTGVRLIQNQAPVETERLREIVKILNQRRTYDD